MANNLKLNNVKEAKNDEFHTQLIGIESELRHYKPYFQGKTVLCNCDDPRVSNFFKYFTINFEHLGLKKVIATCYKNQNIDLFSQNKSEQAVYIVYEGDLNGNKIPEPEEYERQGGICPHCVKEHREKTHWGIDEMEADHITPWCEGGKTVAENCQLLCVEHNRRKSSK